ncbi:malonate decarboxylase subunit epsilon [Enterococcus phoeniculicola]|jgi:malonate decarboxylase epsilon subunit|uniref:[acyl-carrier-protein] S-malonyltransferase n=1 Tax=Enterococcus phoeniculicola ATCC BAA-412 TaxID=1158610 RepID=R3WDI7_9ENTE|nr:acyltransferase domain-containing protein [Enterococcus phoeniculicola]EOL45487.1 malonate decarboxylase subunit epsilon [Enterococcus phoeniculicola ATCC BAA-412]EOT74849.1 malonate decarboxylase subunit epsilon [Enterococcus phoeniculicola ATCC BAA-412]OJG73712.1 malonate decarboxylase subunit epsilon [Enterococcus phoeniculicola]
MSSGFLFPGQGSQSLGLLADVPKFYIDKCKEVTGILLEETPSSYEDTVFIQLALVVKAAFYTDELKKRKIFPDITAGHSIGAFAAAYACETLCFDEMLSLVYKRASLMKQAYPTGFGMGVIVGLTRTEVERVVKETFDEAHPVYVSNENCPMQQTISGSIEAMSRTLEKAKQYQAQTAKLLKVPVPSHCVLMDDTVKAFASFVEEAQLSPPSCTYMKNIDGRSTTDKEEIRQDLLTNIAHPVQWNRMMDVTKELGMTIGIEFPPGNTLTKLYQAKFGEEIRTINLAQHGIEDTVFLYEKWR